MLTMKREDYEKVKLSKDRQFERMYAVAQLKSADEVIWKRMALDDRITRASVKYDELYEKHLTSNKEQ